MPDNPKSVRFNYVKSTHFRVIHADGAYGGVTPYGDIFLSLYNDRTTTPDMTVQAVSEEGVLGAEISEKTVGKRGIERELEVCAVMSLRTAKALRDWLEERIKVVEGLQEKLKPATEPKESEVKQ